MFQYIFKKSNSKYEDCLIANADRREVLEKITRIMKIKYPARRWKLIRENENILLSFILRSDFENDVEKEFSALMLSQMEMLRRRERNSFLIFLMGIAIAVLMLVTLKG